MSSIKQDIKDVVDLLNDPAWVDAELKRKAQMAMPEIIEAACHILAGLDPSDADASITDIVDAAEELYDEYLMPLDLPLNDFIEGFLDRGLKRAIEPAILSFHQWLYP